MDDELAALVVDLALAVELADDDAIDPDFAADLLDRVAKHVDSLPIDDRRGFEAYLERRAAAEPDAGARAALEAMLASLRDAT